MQFFYQFPQRTERLVLVSCGGLGHEVSPLLRSATLPGVSALLSLAAHPRLLSGLRHAGNRMRASGARQGVYLQAIARALRPLEEPGARKAFLHTLRAVIDVRGQRVSATDRLYLLAGMPTLIVWGERDHTIPLAHGRDAHHAAPGSRFETLPRAAHFPIWKTPRDSRRSSAASSPPPSPPGSRTVTGVRSYPPTRRGPGGRSGRRLEARSGLSHSLTFPGG